MLDDLREVLDWYLRRYAGNTQGLIIESSSASTAVSPDQGPVTLPAPSLLPGKPYWNSLGNLLLPVPEAFIPADPPWTRLWRSPV